MMHKALPLAALLALSAPPLALWAQEDASRPGAVATLDLAARLYARALATDDALAAVAAFRMARAVTLRSDPQWDMTTKDSSADDLAYQLPDGAVQDAGTPPPDAGTEASDQGPAGADADFSAIALVTGGMEAATRDLAAGNEDLLALLEDAAAETARGRIGGANQEMALLAPGKTDVWEIPFAGLERAEIGVFSDGAGGLGWMVTDAAGLPVCLQHYSEDPLYCAFTPAENAFYKVTIVSRAETESQYLLATN